MKNLSSEETDLPSFFKELGDAARIVAPVAREYSRTFTTQADTFDAINRDPRALQDTIAETPPTLLAATDSFRVQTPFLARFADVSRRLGPGAAELRRALPLINGALAAGVPAFRETPELGDRIDQLLSALATLSENPNTLLSLRDLRRALQVTTPAIQQIAPYQTVCNYLVYFFNPLGTHLSETVPGGTQERIKAKLTDLTQPNTLGTTESLRPVDVPTDQDPQEGAVQALHTQYGGPAIDSKGNADCQSGQSGYPNRLVTDPRWPPDSSAGGFIGGGSHVVVDANTPGLAGGTYKARDLGIDNLKDVP